MKLNIYASFVTINPRWQALFHAIADSTWGHEVLTIFIKSWYSRLVSGLRRTSIDQREVETANQALQ